MRFPGWVNLLCRSKNPKAREVGLAIRGRLLADYLYDLELLRSSPAYAGLPAAKSNPQPREEGA